jgi:hypothetical protein
MVKFTPMSKIRQKIIENFAYDKVINSMFSEKLLKLVL